MDKEETNQQENPSLLPETKTAKLEDYSPRKPPGGGSNGGGGGGGDRLKRDEWSEGAVSSLLEAYESKWILRNRAKLKGQDWEDVARFVSSRSNNGKSPKTQTQCKNKIESMKKRYRSESATAGADASSWPLYSRLDLLLRGNALPPPPPPTQPPPPLVTNPPLILLELPLPLPLPPPPPPTAAHNSIGFGTAQNSHESNGVDRLDKEDGGIDQTKQSDHHLSDKNNAMETDSSSTPALYSDEKEERMKSKKKTKTTTTTRIMEDDHKRKSSRRRRREDWEIGESIRWLAEVVVRSEQARMETLRELEKMRAEAEAKRGEMDLKRTEIIANTQLEIAKLFAGISSKGVDSSLRIGRS